MIRLNKMGYTIGDRTLFSGVDLTINQHDRFGLVGANGTGKTTLMRIIAGELRPTDGQIERRKVMRIGYLPQEEIVLSGNTLHDEVLQDYHHHLQTLSRLGESMRAHPKSADIMRDYERAEAAFHAAGGYDSEAVVYKILHGLGFTEAEHQKPVEEFSSGWQMRIVLARMLLQSPDLLLLDEPTNHLDIESIQWLEDYLQRFNGALLVISHDRYFLDRILQAPKGTFGVFEIDAGLFRRYRTNYSGYLYESAQRKQRLLHMAKTQEKKIREIKEFIARNRANKSKARLVRSREHYLERLERVQAEAERKKIRVTFPLQDVHSMRLAELDHVNHEYDGKRVLRDVSLLIEKGDRIALIGKNGAGKSTLCRIIAGFEKPTRGERWASSRLSIGAFSHDILLSIDPANTVLDEALKDAAPHVHQVIRGFLGLFLFTGDDVFKKVEVLSGGEKTRLVILKAMLEPSNLLILDEPTYHLDKDSVDAIKSALRGYNGTIILVTHDRDLIADFATRIVEMKNGRIYDYPGDYSYYLYKKGIGTRPAEGAKPGKKETSRDKKRRKISAIEERRKKLRASFSKPGVIDNPRKAKKLFHEYQKLTIELEELEKQISITG
jgi:ATP-binding cassette subfamily F protein 3